MYMYVMYMYAHVQFYMHNLWYSVGVLLQDKYATYNSSYDLGQIFLMHENYLWQ